MVDIFSLLPLIDGGWDYNYGVPPPKDRKIVLKPNENKIISSINHPGWFVILLCQIRGLKKTGEAKYVVLKLVRPIELCLSPAIAYQIGDLDLETYVITLLSYKVDEDFYVFYLIASPPLPFARHQLPFTVEVWNPTSEEVEIFWNIVYISIYDEEQFKSRLRKVLGEVLPK